MSTDTAERLNGSGHRDPYDVLDRRGEPFSPGTHMVNDDGTPRLTKDGFAMRIRGPAAGSAPKSPASTRKTPGTDYRPGLNGLFQMAAAGLMLASPVDAVAVMDHSPPIVEALQTTAEAVPAFADALDKILTMGPYGMLIAAILPLAAQVAHNHGWLPEGTAVALGAAPLRTVKARLKVPDGQQDA